MTAEENPLMSEEELGEINVRMIERLVARLDDDDIPGARRAAARTFSEFESMHRLYYRRWVTDTVTFIVDRWGEGVLQEAMDAGADAWWTPNIDELETGSDDPAQAVRWFASGLCGHLVGLDATEDDQQVVMQMTPRGSGGRPLMESTHDGEDTFATLPGSPASNYGLPDSPIYYARQPAMERIAIRRYGSPFVAIDPAPYCTTWGPARRGRRRGALRFRDLEGLRIDPRPVLGTAGADTTHGEGEERWLNSTNGRRNSATPSSRTVDTGTSSGMVC